MLRITKPASLGYPVQSMPAQKKGLLLLQKGSVANGAFENNDGKERIDGQFFLFDGREHFYVNVSIVITEWSESGIHKRR